MGCRVVLPWRTASVLARCALAGTRAKALAVEAKKAILYSPQPAYPLEAPYFERKGEVCIHGVKLMTNCNSTPQSDDLSRHILQREIGWERALGRNDTAWLDEVMADDWRMISAEGQVITKARALSALRSGVLRYDAVTFHDVEVRVYAGVAVVMGRSREQGRLREKPFDERYIFTDAFIPCDGAWRSVLTHLTHIPH